jgi:hypothetical protein
MHRSATAILEINRNFKSAACPDSMLNPVASVCDRRTSSFLLPKSYHLIESRKLASFHGHFRFDTISIMP